MSPLRAPQSESSPALFNDAIPPELVPFESLKDSSTHAPLQGIHMHTVLSLLSFSNTQTPKGFYPSFFSHRWRNWMPSWLSFYSSNLLLSLQGVQQPCEDPSVDSSSKFQNSKSSLLPVPVCTLSQCPPGRVSSHRTSNSSVLCALLAPAQCPLGRALRILSDSGSS
jgi:hypothetical protein